MACKRSTFIIKQIVFSTTRLNYKIPRPHHCRNLICIKARGIYHALCLNVAFSRVDCKKTGSTFCPAQAFNFLNSMNLSFTEELNTVHHRIFRKSPGCHIRAYNSGRFCKQGPAGFLTYTRFQFMKFFTINYTKGRHTISLATLVKLLNMLHVIIIKSNNQRAIILIIKMKCLCQLRVHCSTLDIELCHQSVWLGIKARMNNSRVSFRSSASYIISLLNNAEVAFIF